jgi:hypothetical protein
MNNNWIKQLSKAYIQLNEAKANIRGQYPFLMTHEKSDLNPSLASSLKRDDLWVAAKTALQTKDHFIHNSKYEKMKTALSNHVAGNTQQEDLEHIVRFMQMDQRFSLDGVRRAWDR